MSNISHGFGQSTEENNESAPVAPALAVPPPGSGSHGHPALCRRPCIRLAKGSCEMGDASWTCCWLFDIFPSGKSIMLQIYGDLYYVVNATNNPEKHHQWVVYTELQMQKPHLVFLKRLHFWLVQLPVHMLHFWVAQLLMQMSHFWFVQLLMQMLHFWFVQLLMQTLRFWFVQLLMQMSRFWFVQLLMQMSHFWFVQLLMQTLHFWFVQLLICWKHWYFNATPVPHVALLDSSPIRRLWNQSKEMPVLSQLACGYKWFGKSQTDARQMSWLVYWKHLHLGSRNAWFVLFGALWWQFDSRMTQSTSIDLCQLCKVSDTNPSDGFLFGATLEIHFSWPKLDVP